MERKTTPRLMILAFRTLSLVFGLAALCGCGPKRKFESGKRMIGIHYSTPGRAMITYLVSTNDVQSIDTSLEELQGEVSVSVRSANERAWELQFVPNVKTGTGETVHYTQELVLPFPRRRVISLRHVGELGIWFLSDAEVSEIEGMTSKNKAN